MRTREHDNAQHSTQTPNHTRVRAVYLKMYTVLWSTLWSSLCKYTLHDYTGIYRGSLENGGELNVKK
jgi:hypothetical protein